MIPDFQTIMLPLMHLLQDGRPCPLNDVMQGLIEHFGLAEADLQVKVPSGQQPLFKNRVTWAISYLKNTGLIYYPQRGVYKITEAGSELLKEKIDRISIGHLKKFDAFKKW